MTIINPHDVKVFYEFTDDMGITVRKEIIFSDMRGLRYEMNVDGQDSCHIEGRISRIRLGEVGK
jgi:hypothetical protein